MAIALVGAVRSKTTLWTGLCTVWSSPTTWAATFTGHVETFASVLARTVTEAPLKRILNDFF